MMITRCPACGTLFRVVPDQLKISEGWVRCGHCADVFDATLSLQDEQALGGGVQPAGPVDAGAGAIDEVTAPEPTPEPTQAPVPPPVQEQAAVAEVVPPPEPLPPPLVVAVPADDEPAYADSVASVASEVRASEPARDLVDDDPLRLHDPELDGVGFVEQARRRLFWSRPAVRALLVVLALVLAALLAGQFAVQDRDRLAAVHPEWRPWLERACEPLGCRIGPPQRIEAIVVDSSGFSRLRPNTYRLSFVLKNQAAQPVAAPSLELTLTDSQDQPLLRRVLSPRDLGAPADTIAAASDWAASVALEVALPAGGASIAGYRLLAFYP